MTVKSRYSHIFIQESEYPVNSGGRRVGFFDILALNTTPIELIAAPGADKAIKVLSVSCDMAMGGGGLSYAGNTDLIVITDTADTYQFLDQKILLTTNNQHLIMQLQAAGLSETQIIENKAVNVMVRAGDPITGDGSMEIFFTYQIVDVI